VAHLAPLWVVAGRGVWVRQRDHIAHLSVSLSTNFVMQGDAGLVLELLRLNRVSKLGVLFRPGDREG
jgi:hypothetical protein